MNRNNKFKAECGFEFGQNNQGEYSPCLVQRTYKDEEQKNKNIVMSKNCEECTAKKVDIARNFSNMTSDKIWPATDTCCLCKNTEWRETKLVDYYNNACSNTITEKEIEIVLQLEDGKRTLYYTEKGNRGFYSIVEDLPRELFEQMYEEEKPERGEPVMLQMIDSNGETFEQEIYNEADIECLMTSVRVVSFKEFEVDVDGKIIREFTH